MKTIDFAIDLGTTNSLIAKQHAGTIEVYKNPIGHKETLPSVVGFRNDRILVGDKAREYLEKDPENVFGGFKRKMGTSETFFVKNLNAPKSPIDLSAIVLKELKTFVYSEQAIASVVITIPASFDTVQSNATKKAGFEAGFKEVVLLQEPIAACLAFANKGDSDKHGKWLVYDLGGGTFDVAIVSITGSELLVIDHQGDNYLGGLDFDSMIVEKIILKKLFGRPGFEKLKQQSETQHIAFKRLYYILLHKAETAKKELSVSQQTEVEFSVENDGGDEVDMIIPVGREEFNQCISEKASYTLDLIATLLERNAISAGEIKQVVLVGGSTYIPYIRELIESKLNIGINASVDPTTAVVIGAAQYAATKRSEAVADAIEKPQQAKKNTGIRVKTSYLRTSMDTEELLMASVEGNLANLQYRIQRDDGGYDSGLKVLNEKIREYLSLATGQVNRFQLKFYSSLQELVEADVDAIEIIQGRYNVHGQPLPNDICLEIDDIEERVTRLELIFARNSVLPLKKTIYREVSKTIYRDSKDKLIVNILEGEHTASPSTNQVIGLIEIDPTDLKSDLVKGSDLEIKLEITESRDLHVNVYLSLTDQEFKNVFHSSERYVSESKLTEEVEILISQIRKDIRTSEGNENYELAGKLDALLQETMIIREGLDTLATTLNSDAKYHLQERKRKVAQKYDQSGKSGKLTQLRVDYFEMKESINLEFSRDAALKEKFERSYQNIVKGEPAFITSQSVSLIESKTKQLNGILWDIRLETREYLIRLFHWLCGMLAEFTDKQQAKRHIEQGEKALERQNYAELKIVNINLLHLMPDRGERYKHFKGTGIG